MWIGSTLSTAGGETMVQCCCSSGVDDVCVGVAWWDCGYTGYVGVQVVFFLTGARGASAGRLRVDAGLWMSDIFLQSSCRLSLIGKGLGKLFLLVRGSGCGEVGFEHCKNVLWKKGLT